MPSCEAARYDDCGTRTVIVLVSLPWLKPHLTMSTHDPSSHCPPSSPPHHSSHIRSLSHLSPWTPGQNHWHPLMSSWLFSLAYTGPADQDLSQRPDPIAKDLGNSLTPGSSASCRVSAFKLRPLSPSGLLSPARPLPRSQPLGQGHLLPGDLPRPAPSSTAQESALPLKTEPWEKVMSHAGPRGSAQMMEGRQELGQEPEISKTGARGVAMDWRWLRVGRGDRTPLGGHRAEAPHGLPGPSLSTSHPE